MQYEVLFVSQTGNTEKLATAIYEAIPDGDKEIQRLNKDTPLDLAETYFIGFWTNRGTCSFEVLDYLSELHGKNIALFGTCGMGNDPAYYERIEKQVNALARCQCTSVTNIRSFWSMAITMGLPDRCCATLTQLCCIPMRMIMRLQRNLSRRLCSKLAPTHNCQMCSKNV